MNNNPHTPFPQPTRKLAASLLAAGPVLPLDGVRAVDRALGRCLPPGTAPSLAAALAAKPAPRAATSPPPPPDPATAARHQALRDAVDQAAYDAMVAAVTAGEREAAARRGTRVGEFRQQLALGAHVTVATGTGFAAGWVAGGAVWRGDASTSKVSGREGRGWGEGGRRHETKKTITNPPHLFSPSASLAASSA